MPLDITINDSPYNAVSGSDIGPPWRLGKADGEAATGQVIFRLNDGTYPNNSKDPGVEYTDLAGRIKNLLVQGQSMAGTKIEKGANGYVPAGGAAGQVTAVPAAPDWSARIKHVLKGATSLECVTHADAARFVSFQGPAWLASFDLQGAGFPTSPFWWENVFITGVNTSTGIITIQRTTRYEHLDTWPCVNPGNNFETDQGGPATLYIMDYTGEQRWNVDLIEFRDIQLNDPGFVGGGSYLTARAKHVIYRRVKTTDPNGIIPSESGTVEYIDVDFSALSVPCEVDKFNDLINVSGSACVHGGFSFQSSSAIELRIQDGATVNIVDGTPKRLTLNNATINTLKLGCYAYGSSDSFYSTNGIIGSLLLGGVKEQGPSAQGVEHSYTMLSDGTLVTPRLQGVTAFANAAGIFRVTIADTSPFISTTKYYNCGVGITDPGDVFHGGTRVTVVDGTHLDLLDVTFTSGATIGIIGIETPAAWCAPDSNCFWLDEAANNRVMGKFTVGNWYVDSLNHYIPTDWQGGAFPPATGGKTTIWVHPCPKLVATNVTNGAGGQYFYNHPAGAPFNSYYHSGAVPLNKTTIGNGSTLPASMGGWGELQSLTFNVIEQYGGSGDPILHWPSIFDNYPAWSKNDATGVLHTLAILIDTKVAGVRQWTKAGGWTGAQPNDVLPTIPVGMWMTSDASFGTNIDISAASETGTALSMTIEAVMDQNVVQREEINLVGKTFTCTFA